MKKNILKKFAIAIASTSLALTAPVMSDASVFGTIQTVEAATVKTPSTVKLNKISAPAYNKIKVSWKKASNATNYYIYYRKTGTKKWEKIASVKNSATSYTHKSSGKYPIIIGQKYDYTVKAYNHKYKKFGKYNTKGLSIKTIPNPATEISVAAKNGKVNISWEKANGADRYIIYRKTSPTEKWVKLATISDTEYTDNNPVTKQDNYYTVRSYYSKTKTYGNYNQHGIEVYVPAYTPVVTPNPTETPATPTPEPTKKPEPTATPSPTEKPQPTETPAPTPSPKPVANPEQMAQEVIRLTNIERAKEGEAPLQYNAKLQEAAMIRAKEISILFSHGRPDGRLFDTAFGEAGVGCPDGENIAKGYPTPERVTNAWMNSQGHRAAILSPTATHIGVGFYKATNGIYYWVQDFSYGPDKTCTLTCNANGGTFSDGQEVKTFTFPCDMEIDFSKYIPTPTKDGYTFVDWDGIPGIVLNISTKVTATWTPNN